MSPNETVEQLMLEIGPLLDLEETAAWQDRQAWQLRFDAHTWLDVEFEPELNRLVISGDIAVVPEFSRTAIYEILLRYNAAWTETGGSRMALDGDDACVVILFDLPVSDVHAGLLAQVLARMADIQRAWRQILQDLAHERASTAS